MTNLHDQIIALTFKANAIEFQKQQLIWSSYDNFESPQQKDRKIEELQDELNGIANEIRSIEEMLNS
jgi:conjugal transfer/entry exclusion protein